jgi:hypothetical protein
MEGNIQGMIKVTGMQRRHQQTLGHLREMIGFWKLKEEEMDCTLWRMCFEWRLWICSNTDYTMEEV